ncbi:MAG: CPBP family intramembrane glutamic endopeptidase [Phycisphaerales bacterium JB039]
MISARVAVIAAIVALLGLTGPAFAQDDGAPPPPGAAQAEPPPGAGGPLSGLDLQNMAPADLLSVGLVASAPFVLIILWLGDVIRPGSFKRKGKRDVSGFPVLIWLFGMFVVFSAQAFGLKVGEALPGLLGSADQAGLPVEALADNPLRDQAIAQVTAFFFALIAGGVMMYLLGAKSDKDGLQIKASDLPIGLAAIVLSVPVLAVASHGAAWAYERYTGNPPDPIAHESLRTIVDNQHDPAAWAIMLTVVLGAPIIEELMFRGFLQSAMLRLFGSAWTAIFVTSGVFVWLHYLAADASGQTMVPLQALPTLFVLSVAMGVAFERTKRIGVPIAMHIGFNAFNTALALMLVDPAAAPAPGAP